MENTENANKIIEKQPFNSDSKFFTFITPFLNYIDKGHIYRKTFSWLYIFFGVVCLLFPIIAFVYLIDAGLLSLVFYLLSWFLMCFVGWIGFQLWWDRSKKVKQTSVENDEFVVTPVFAHFVQTLGEWYGSTVAIMGFGTGLFTLLFSPDRFSRNYGIDFIPGIGEFGWISIFVAPIIGFFIIIITRFVAEQFRAFSSIANNTRGLATESNKQQEIRGQHETVFERKATSNQSFNKFGTDIHPKKIKYIVASSIGLLAFFMPWAGGFIDTYNGYEIYKITSDLGSSYSVLLFLIPISFVISIISKFSKKIISPTAIKVIEAIPIALIVFTIIYLLIKTEGDFPPGFTEDLFGSILKVGFYLTVVASIFILFSPMDENEKAEPRNETYNNQTSVPPPSNIPPLSEDDLFD